MEFESFVQTDAIDRHYAFPCGDNDLTRLPTLIHLPASYEEFEIEDFNASMSLDLNFSAGVKVEQEKDQPIPFESSN